MRVAHVGRACLPTLYLLSSLFGGWVAKVQSQTVVRFPTEDGVMIYATLHLPEAPHSPVAGAILLAEPDWTVRTTLEGHARSLVKDYGMAALTVDFRGNAKNVLEGKIFRTFSAEDKDNMQLDVRGAIKFLSSQKVVDPKRIGILAAGIGANYALLEASRNPGVQALVLMSGSLSDPARKYIESRSDIPILCLASKDDDKGLRQMVDAFTLSKSKNKDLIVLPAGHGTRMFAPNKGLAEQVRRWLADNVSGGGIETEISLKTEDGWVLHGRLRMPGGLTESVKVPGVVLIHGANHDQETYYDLVKELARHKIATLTYDWRGRNLDLDDPKAHFAVNLPSEEREKAYLDAKAAISFLASQKGVDPNQIGLIAATAGTEQAYKASIGDDRIRTIVALTQDAITDSLKQFVTTMDVPVLFVASTEDVSSGKPPFLEIAREAYLMSKSRYSQLLLFDGAGHGSEMMKNEDSLQPMIVRWFVDKLAQPSSVTTPPAKSR